MSKKTIIDPPRLKIECGLSLSRDAIETAVRFSTHVRYSQNEEPAEMDRWAAEDGTLKFWKGGEQGAPLPCPLPPAALATIALHWLEDDGCTVVASRRVVSITRSYVRFSK